MVPGGLFVSFAFTTFKQKECLTSYWLTCSVLDEKMMVEFLQRVEWSAAAKAFSRTVKVAFFLLGF